MLKRRTVEDAKDDLGMCLANPRLQRGRHQRIDLTNFAEDRIRLLREPLAARSLIQGTAFGVRHAGEGGSRWCGKDAAPLLRPEQRAGCDVDRPGNRIGETDWDVDSDDGVA